MDTDAKFFVVSAAGDISQLRSFYDEHKWAKDHYFFLTPGTSRYLRTPLHTAAWHGHLATVQFLVEEIGCDPHYLKKAYDTPLHYACFAGHLEVVKYLLSVCPEMINQRSLEYQTPLHICVCHGHVLLVKFLCNFPGVDVNAKSHYTTPLHDACLHGDFATVKYLCAAKGFNMHIECEGRSALSCACVSGNLYLVRFLIEECNMKPDQLSLTRACWKGYAEIVSYLLQFPEVDINKDSGRYKFAISEAVRADRYSVVKVLLASHQRVKSYVEYDAGDFLQCRTFHEVSTLTSNPEILSLLSAYEKNPDLTRHQLRCELGLADKDAAAFFSLVIFFTDGFLRFRPMIGGSRR